MHSLARFRKNLAKMYFSSTRVITSVDLKVSMIKKSLFYENFSCSHVFDRSDAGVTHPNTCPKLSWLTSTRRHFCHRVYWHWPFWEPKAFSIDVFVGPPDNRLSIRSGTLEISNNNMRAVEAWEVHILWPTKFFIFHDFSVFHRMIHSASSQQRLNQWIFRRDQISSQKFMHKVSLQKKHV